MRLMVKIHCNSKLNFNFIHLKSFFLRVINEIQLKATKYCWRVGCDLNKIKVLICFKCILKDLNKAILPINIQSCTYKVSVHF